MATFVLVHGAFCGGYWWGLVAPLLRAAGHQVFTPTLTGLGEREHLASPAIDLDTHVQDIVNVLCFEALREAILVGHSYGGMVITGVAGRVPDRLGHLVYLDAVVPELGESMADLLGPEVFHRWFVELAQGSGDGWLVPPLPPDGGAGPALATLVLEMLNRRTGQPLKTFTQPLATGAPVAAAWPRTYILCTAKPPEALSGSPLAVAAARARAAGWRYRELASGHRPMLDRPQELTDLLLECV